MLATVLHQTIPQNCHYDCNSQIVELGDGSNNHPWSLMRMQPGRLFS
jgi:hypothetical protein